MTLSKKRQKGKKEGRKAERKRERKKNSINKASSDSQISTKGKKT